MTVAISLHEDIRTIYHFAIGIGWEAYMRQSIEGISFRLFVARGIAFAVLSAVMLGGCQTDGTGIDASLATANSAEPKTKTVTHTEAAAQCWMSTEKGAASLSLDKRADVVNKCIDDKMKGAPAVPQS
jgi:hypothetical protein